MQLQIVEQNYGNIALIELPAFFSLVFKRSSKAFEVLGQIRQILAENGQQQAVEDFLGMERDLPVPGGRQVWLSISTSLPCGLSLTLHHSP
jgi:hypothetical protein